MKFVQTEMDSTSVNNEKRGESGAGGTLSAGSTRLSGAGVNSELGVDPNTLMKNQPADVLTAPHPGHSSQNMNDLSSVLPQLANANELRGTVDTSLSSASNNYHASGLSQGNNGGSGERVICVAGTDNEEEDERADDERLSSTLTFTTGSQRQHRNRPGVILLGRGNSFSLGRSEVILLHGNRNKKTSSRTNDSNNNANLVDSSRTDCDNIVNNDNDVVVSQHNMNISQGHPAPPLISNGDSPGVITNGVRNAPGGHFAADELELLWRKAESIMVAKQGVVQRVLEEFGVGEAGGGGEKEENERVAEEENVWQAVQENFQV